MIRIFIALVCTWFLASCATVNKACETVHTTAQQYADVLVELEKQGIDPKKNSQLVRKLKAVRNGLIEAHGLCYEQ